MKRTLKTPERRPARGAVAVASFVASAACLCAVVLVFDHASSEPFLRDSAQARVAVERCEELRERAARDRCVQRLATQAQARDAEAARPTAVAAVGTAAAERRFGTSRTLWR